MPVRTFQLLAFEDLRLVHGDLLEEGSLYWLLARWADVLFPAWLFKGWKGEKRLGRPGWGAPLLMSMLLLRWSETGISRKASVRRANHDAQWRAALRLPWHAKPPREKTLREFEAFLRTQHPDAQLPRFLVVFEHWVRLCLEQGVVGEERLPVIDSTPMWCYGAVLGTVNLLGEGVRSLAKRWARARRVSLEAVALEWGAPLVLAKSTKGFFADTDWSDASERSMVLETLIELVTRCVGSVQDGIQNDDVRENKRLPLTRLCRNLLRIVEEDLETADDGTIVVVRRQTSSRLISLTDPDAQHFRKSASKVCQGFKLHVLGDALSGLILALDVTPGGDHDSTQAHPLISRAKALLGDLREVLGDAAYGGMRVRGEVRALGVDLLAPPMKNTRKGDTLGKEHFTIDFDQMVATCPGGVTTATWQPAMREGEPTQAFIWDKGTKAECSCADRCLVHKARKTKDKKTKEERTIAPGFRLVIHPQEQELRRVRAEWKGSDARQRYRGRSQGERLIHEMTRRGARRASAWGLDRARLQAFCIAAVNNLRLLAAKLAVTVTPSRVAT